MRILPNLISIIVIIILFSCAQHGQYLDPKIIGANDWQTEEAKKLIKDNLIAMNYKAVEFFQDGFKYEETGVRYKWAKPKTKTAKGIQIPAEGIANALLGDYWRYGTGTSVYTVRYTSISKIRLAERETESGKRWVYPFYLEGIHEDEKKTIQNTNGQHLYRVYKRGVIFYFETRESAERFASALLALVAEAKR